MDPTTTPGEISATSPDAANLDGTIDASSGVSDDTSVAASGEPATSDTPATSEPTTLAEAASKAFDEAVADPTKVDPKTTAAPVAAKPEEAKTEAQAPGDADGKELADPSKEEIAAMAPNTRRRVNQLLTQRAELRNEVNAYRADAEAFNGFREVVKGYGLAPEHVDPLLQIGGHLRRGPEGYKAFLAAVEPVVANVREALGLSVPTDLQGRVDQGDMTEDTARELARTRHQAAIADTRAQEAQRAGQGIVAEQHRSGVHKAVTDWQAKTQAADPDFHLKSEPMQTAAKALIAERGTPKTAAEAVAMAQEAHATATRWLRSAAPKPAATRPTPTGASASPNRSGQAPSPKNMTEVVEQAMGRFAGN